MSQVCPSCNSALDPAHAPIARIKGARVVAYCSAKCADAADTSAVGVAVVRGETPSEPGQKLASAPSPKSPVAAQSVKKPAVKSVPSKASGPTEKSPHSTAFGPTEKSPGYEDASEIRRLHVISEPASAGTRRMSASLRKRVLWASGGIMFGGMGIAAIQTLSLGSPSSVSASQTSAKEASKGEVVVVALTPDEALADKGAVKQEPASTPVLSSTQLREAAVVELGTQLEKGTPRFQRVAGLALARISHPQALEVLALLLKSEDSDLARIDIAFGLARGGDELGRAYLVSELGSKRRDVRIDAGRRLAQLKDDSGTKALTNMLKVRSHRLGAASVLALLGDEAGLAILRQTMSSPKSSEENRMRAAVGLGLSGEASVKPDLIAILQGERFVVDAAGALAVLGDSSAIPALKRQLELSSMCVSAAESLAAMGHEVDLRGLASALLTSDELGRTAAAEAILILTQDQEANAEE